MAFSRFPWVTQPQGPLVLERGHPLSQGLILDAQGNKRFRDLAGLRVPTQSVGSLPAVSSPLGQGAGFSSAVTSFGDIELFTGSQVTFQVLEVPANLTQVAGLVNKRSSGTSQHSFSFGYNYNAANEFTVDVGDAAGTAVGTNYRFSSAGFRTSGNNIVILIDGQAGTGQKIRVFRNGVAASNVLNNADNTFSAFTNTTAPLEIGRVNNATLYYAGTILLVRAWRRVLSVREVGALSENPWQLYQPVRRNAVFGVGGGGATLSPGLLTNAQTFYAPTITTGAVSLAPPILTNVSTLYEPVVSAGAFVVQPPLLTNAQTFYGPTITTGAVLLQPGLLTNLSTLYAPEVTQFAPGVQSVQPPLLTNVSVVYSPSIAIGGVQVSPPLINSEAVPYAPLVLSGGSLLQAPLIDAQAQVYAPAVTAGAVEVLPPLLASAAILYSPVVSQPGGVQSLTAPLLLNESTLYGPTVGERSAQTYPLAGFSQDFPLAGQAQTYPLG